VASKAIKVVVKKRHTAKQKLLAVLEDRELWPIPN
jgi:hypothetical protein